MNAESKELAGRIAVVTGGGRGLGRAIALALSKAGAAVVLAGRNAESLEATAQELRNAAGTADWRRCDVTREDHVRALGAAVRQLHGRVDILVNNAGVNVRKPVTDFSLAEWASVLDTNLTGVFLLCREFVPLMKGRGYGRIVNLTSIMSHVALPGRSAYAASKAGLLGFTRALALELAAERITVNGISPGPVATEMNRPIIGNPELNAQFTARIPLGRWGAEEEIAHLARYLCSDQAGFITGTDIVADGGWTAQ